MAMCKIAGPLIPWKRAVVFCRVRVPYMIHFNFTDEVEETPPGSGARQRLDREENVGVAVGGLLSGSRAVLMGLVDMVLRALTTAIAARTPQQYLRTDGRRIQTRNWWDSAAPSAERNLTEHRGATAPGLSQFSAKPTARGRDSARLVTGLGRFFRRRFRGMPR